MMRSVLGEDWHRLAPLVQRHFAVGESARDAELVLDGHMEVRHRGPGRVVFPLLGRFGVLVPYQGREIPCSVRHRVEGSALVWERAFHFPGKAVYRFPSYMSAAGPGRCLERVRLGFAIRMAVTCEDGALVFRDDGYVWQVGAWRLPLRLRWLLGALRVEERQAGDGLVVSLTLEHRWFGELFVYRGRFEIVRAAGRGEESLLRSRTR